MDYKAGRTAFCNCHALRALQEGKRLAVCIDKGPPALAGVAVDDVDPAGRAGIVFAIHHIVRFALANFSARPLLHILQA